MAELVSLIDQSIDDVLIVTPTLLKRRDWPDRSWAKIVEKA